MPVEILLMFYHFATYIVENILPEYGMLETWGLRRYHILWYQPIFAIPIGTIPYRVYRIILVLNWYEVSFYTDTWYVLPSCTVYCIDTIIGWHWYWRILILTIKSLDFYNAQCSRIHVSSYINDLCRCDDDCYLTMWTFFLLSTTLLHSCSND